jgi:hypothetical protein
MRWIFLFNLPNPSSRTMALGSTQPLTEMSTRYLPGGGKGRPARRADLWADCLENVGASTSQTPMGLHGLLQWQLYLFFNNDLFKRLKPAHKSAKASLREMVVIDFISSFVYALNWTARWPITDPTGRQKQCINTRSGQNKWYKFMSFTLTYLWIYRLT